MAPNQLKKSHKSTFCCPNVQVPSSTSGPLLSHFLLALKTVHEKQQLPLFRLIRNPERSFQTGIELEARGTQLPYFFFYYYMPLMEGVFADKAYRTMYPEESYIEIEPGVVENKWAKEKKWWRREEAGELGVHRMGWECQSCGWKYWARVMVFENTED